MSTPSNMKTLILVCICICLTRADSHNENSKKPGNTKTTNSIQTSSKQPVFYQQFQYQAPHHVQQAQNSPQTQHQTHQLIPVQLIQRPYYTTQAGSQPAIMIIAAHPSVVTPHVVYGSATQQLLNYFHSNPQAKYQLLHGNQQQQTSQSQPHYVQQVTPSQSVGAYQIVPAPVAYQQPHHVMVPVSQVPVSQVPASHVPVSHVPVSHVPVSHIPHYQANTQPATQSYSAAPMMQLSQLAHLAQLAAQQYAASPLRSPPAIVTGFENFSPEQQAQIKAQLATHLGTPVNLHASQNQYSSKYVAHQHPNLNTDEFIPSQPIKSDGSKESSAEVSSKTQYSKG